jgi:hypothetical protein
MIEVRTHSNSRFFEAAICFWMKQIFQLALQLEAFCARSIFPCSNPHQRALTRFSPFFSFSVLYFFVDSVFS